MAALHYEWIQAENTTIITLSLAINDLVAAFIIQSTWYWWLFCYQKMVFAVFLQDHIFVSIPNQCAITTAHLLLLNQDSYICVRFLFRYCELVIKWCFCGSQLCGKEEEPDIP